MLFNIGIKTDRKILLQNFVSGLEKKAEVEAFNAKLGLRTYRETKPEDHSAYKMTQSSGGWNHAFKLRHPDHLTF